MSNTYRFRPARTADYSKVIEMWMAGISSDRIAIASIADTWWKRLLFRHIAGRRIFVQDMDTFVIEVEEGLCGYVGLQREEDTLSVFDWGLALHWDGSAEEAFQVLLDGVLDKAYEDEDTNYLIIGMESGEQPIREIIAAQDFQLLDYQAEQAVAELPISSPAERGETDLSLGKMLGREAKDSMDDWIEESYEDPQVAEMVTAIHHSVPTRSQAYEIRDAGEAVGFVQSGSHQSQARFIYALKRQYWGTAFEKLVLTSYCTQLAGRDRGVRIRTFASAHMQASRAAMEELGLTCQPSPWERWVHKLFEDQEEKEPEDL